MHNYKHEMTLRFYHNEKEITEIKYALGIQFLYSDNFLPELLIQKCLLTAPWLPFSASNTVPSISPSRCKGALEFASEIPQHPAPYPSSALADGSSAPTVRCTAPSGRGMTPALPRACSDLCETTLHCSVYRLLATSKSTGKAGT